MFSGYDVIHYHCLGPALFSFLPRLTGKKTSSYCAGPGLAAPQVGSDPSQVLRWGETAARQASARDDSRFRKLCNATTGGSTAIHSIYP